MSDYCCSVFKEAIMDGIIKKPGQRIPHTITFSPNYFITKHDELRELTLYMNIHRCPNCGKGIKVKKKENR